MLIVYLAGSSSPHLRAYYLLIPSGIITHGNGTLFPVNCYTKLSLSIEKDEWKTSLADLIISPVCVVTVKPFSL